MLGLVSLLTASHVPTYTGGAGNCYTPPHHHDTSQVIYLKSSGGLELHITSPTSPFDIPGGEVLDVDAVFKKKYDQSTYSLYIGCGGCVASQDPIVIPPVVLDGYEPGEVEPFTQTVYYSVFPKADRKFNASDLDGCSENHFTIRVVHHHNRTNGEELVWGAVIGLGEQFTFIELLSFPMFVLNNHGQVWNDMAWTAPLSFVIFAPLLVWLARRGLSGLGVPIVELDMKITIKNYRPYIEGKWAAREWLYELAILAFAGTMIEEFIHLIYAQIGAPVGYGLWVGLLGVIGGANGLPIFQVVVAWAALKHVPGSGRLCVDGFFECSASVWWAPLEIIFGVSYLFLFGAGFYLGPACIVVAGALRIGELLGSQQSRGFARVPPPTTPAFPPLFF